MQSQDPKHVMLMPFAMRLAAEGAPIDKPRDIMIIRANAASPQPIDIARIHTNFARQVALIETHEALARAYEYALTCARTNETLMRAAYHRHNQVEIRK